MPIKSILKHKRPFVFLGIILLIKTTTLTSQNLIRNSSFDEVLPYSHGVNASSKRHHFTDNTRYWDTPTGGTPDIWLEEYRSDPLRNRGMEPLKPRTGESMIGIRIYGCTKVFGTHCREYIQTKTTETLKAGNCYEYEFFALSTVSGIRINNIGIGFSEFKMNDLTTTKTMELDYIFQEEEIVHEGVGKWVKISSRFTPEQDYNHVIIGNFSDDKDTKIKKLSNGKGHAYYFIDDVSIFKIDCETSERKNETNSFVLDNINFNHDSFEIKKEGKKVILEIYNQIIKSSYSSISINGYTDDTGTDSYNRKLSLKRAESVLEELVKLGIPLAQVQATGHGNTIPIDPKNKAKNRRVEIIVD
jgi:hypothetical protein